MTYPPGPSGMRFNIQNWGSRKSGKGLLVVTQNSDCVGQTDFWLGGKAVLKVALMVRVI